MNSTNFKVGDIVKIKDSANPNYRKHSDIRIINTPKKIVSFSNNIRAVVIEPALEVYRWEKRTKSFHFSNYNNTLGIDTLEYANALNLNNKLFEI